MQMLYNSDNYVVVQFDPPALAGGPVDDDGTALTRSGYEIVDKFARKEIYIEGALAERFKLGVQALVDGDPSKEVLDDYIAGFTGLAQNPLVLH